MEACDTLTVLRDGKIIRTFEKAEFEAGAIRASMIGRELQGDSGKFTAGSGIGCKKSGICRPVKRDFISGA